MSFKKKTKERTDKDFYSCSYRLTLMKQSSGESILHYDHSCSVIAFTHGGNACMHVYLIYFSITSVTNCLDVIDVPTRPVSEMERRV